MVEEKKKADLMWESLKGIDLFLYGLPGQTIEKNAERLDVLPDQLFLRFTRTAALPIFEEALKQLLFNGEKFTLEQKDDITIVKTEPAKDSEWQNLKVGRRVLKTR